MKIKKIISVVSAIALVMALSACGNKPQDSSEASSTTQQGDSSQIAEESKDGNSSAAEEVTVEPTQGDGEGATYINEFFGLHFEFPEGWERSATGPMGETDFPYYTCTNNKYCSAEFFFITPEDTVGDAVETGEIVINGQAYEGIVAGTAPAFINIKLEKDGYILRCSISDGESKTVAEYQAFIDSISK